MTAELAEMVKLLQLLDSRVTVLEEKISESDAKPVAKKAAAAKPVQKQKPKKDSLQRDLAACEK